MGFSLRNVLNGVLATNPVTAPFFWGKKAADKAAENPEMVKDTLALGGKVVQASPGVFLAKKAIENPDALKTAGKVVVATNPITAPFFWGAKAAQKIGGFLGSFFGKAENREKVLNGVKTAAVVTNPVLLGAVGAKKLAENENVQNAVSSGARTLAQVSMATNPVTAPVFWGKKLAENPELLKAAADGAKSAEEVVNQVLDYPLDEAAKKAAVLYVEMELKKAEALGNLAENAVTGLNQGIDDAQRRIDERARQ